MCFLWIAIVDILGYYWEIKILCINTKSVALTPLPSAAGFVRLPSLTIDESAPVFMILLLAISTHTINSELIIDTTLKIFCRFGVKSKWLFDFLQEWVGNETTHCVCCSD